ncbi:protein-L-isoaspartate(D-aspartate) O-methyltransferase [Candidatus Woesearchaeota archaeon]|nr:protein-L-isoaspartate(D-aspartate) O-methyltransferase [Candidatus Woesearchaeota archaeon]
MISEKEFGNRRKVMVENLRDQRIEDENVLEAFEKIPRHVFVPKQQLDLAYHNIPLEIAQGQTISQPYTIAVMLEALELKKGDKVLEVGTCSGYNAALIGYVVGSRGFVCTTEIVPELVAVSEYNLNKLGIKNVEIIATDGSLGWPEKAPYDKIIVTAACPRIPPLLIEQLKENGILVAPVGPRFGQRMIKAVKKEGRLRKTSLGMFVFVPLKGKYGY